jgi:hypothetical protein
MNLHKGIKRHFTNTLQIIHHLIVLNFLIMQVFLTS